MEDEPNGRSKRGAEIVAIILAVGLATGFNIFCVAALYGAIADESGISENATQVLTGWGGGIIGVLGAYVGYRAASRRRPPE